MQTAKMRPPAVIKGRFAAIWAIGRPWYTRFAITALATACLHAVPAWAQVNAFGVPNTPEAPPRAEPAPAPPAPVSPEPAQPAAPRPASPRYSTGPVKPPAQPRPAPAPPPPRPAEPYRYLVGQWHGQTAEASGSWDVLVTFNADNTFTQQRTLASAQFRLSMVGTYSAEVSGSTGLITVVPRVWSPREFCKGLSCSPINFTAPVLVRFQKLGANSMQTANGLFERIGAAH